VIGEITDSSHDMKDLGHQPLPAGKFGQASTTRTVILKNLMAGFFIEQVGE
jgi:hypothetical protein